MIEVEIDPKYCTTSLNVLSEEEIMRELKTPKTQVNIYLFNDDLEFAKEHGVNLNRIIRFKFHEWLQEKSIGE